MNKKAILDASHFNRKFLPEEIEQMKLNEKLRVKGRKRYIYNPAIHGDDEAKFKEWFERMNSGKHLINSDMGKQIKEDNIKKIESGETIRLIPWKANIGLDPSGLRFGLTTSIM